MTGPVTRAEVRALLVKNIAELQRLLRDLDEETDDLELWTYVEDLENVIPANLSHEAGELSKRMDGE